MAGIALDIDGALFTPFAGMHNGTAAHRAVGADRGGFFGILDLERFGLVPRRRKHAALAGAGEREKSFWRNYFFHCALARYEAGLSVDEIWGDQPLELPKDVTVASAAAAADEASEHHVDETITFEPASPARPASDVLDDAGAATTASVGASLSAPSTGGAPSISSGAGGPAAAGGPSMSQNSSASDYSPYEMVGSGGGVGAGATDGDGEPEDMDDLEAEIARELEGLED